MRVFRISFSFSKATLASSRAATLRLSFRVIWALASASGSATGDTASNSSSSSAVWLLRLDGVASSLFSEEAEAEAEAEAEEAEAMLKSAPSRSILTAPSEPEEVEHGPLLPSKAAEEEAADVAEADVPQGVAEEEEAEEEEEEEENGEAGSVASSIGDAPLSRPPSSPPRAGEAGAASPPSPPATLSPSSPSSPPSLSLSPWLAAIRSAMMCMRSCWISSSRLMMRCTYVSRSSLCTAATTRKPAISDRASSESEAAAREADPSNDGPVAWPSSSAMFCAAAVVSSVDVDDGNAPRRTSRATAQRAWPSRRSSALAGAAPGGRTAEKVPTWCVWVRVWVEGG